MTVRFKKIIAFSFIFIFLITALLMCYSSTMQNGIANKLIRLHIVANSNSPADQALKLKVRDRILKEGKDIFGNLTDINTCRSSLEKELPRLIAAAEEEIHKNGYNYSVSANTGKHTFPMKVYGNFALPSGEYDALKIEIGNAKGENWWCVMFPPLCFINGCIDSEYEKTLSESLSQEELSLISYHHGVNLRFKTVDFFQKSIKTIKTAFIK